MSESCTPASERKAYFDEDAFAFRPIPAAKFRRLSSSDIGPLRAGDPFTGIGSSGEGCSGPASRSNLASSALIRRTSSASPARLAMSR